MKLAGLSMHQTSQQAHDRSKTETLKTNLHSLMRLIMSSEETFYLIYMDTVNFKQTY